MKRPQTISYQKIADRFALSLFETKEYFGVLSEAEELERLVILKLKTTKELQNAYRKCERKGFKIQIMERILERMLSISKDVADLAFVAKSAHTISNFKIGQAAQDKIDKIVERKLRKKERLDEVSLYHEELQPYWGHMSRETQRFVVRTLVDLYLEENGYSGINWK